MKILNEDKTISGAFINAVIIKRYYEEPGRQLPLNQFSGLSSDT